ncbi:hypothetical protein ACET3Z_000406 [Daucus carota]
MKRALMSIWVLTESQNMVREPGSVREFSGGGQVLFIRVDCDELAWLEQEDVKTRIKHANLLLKSTIFFALDAFESGLSSSASLDGSATTMTILSNGDEV